MDDWLTWFWVVMPIALLIFVAIFGPNKVKGKKWRGEREPSVMLGPERPDPPDSRRY